MSARTRLWVVAPVALGVAAVSVAHIPSEERQTVAACSSVATAIRVGDTLACVHPDVPPPGVDPTVRPGTAELQQRPGAAAAVIEAAADLGVPTPTTAASTASSPAVACDGDGRSGYRIQAMYVVESNRTNRYAALKSSLQRWAAGTDDVVNRSAALTGGVRHIRYVTVPSGTTCVAEVLNVTVPAGSLATFASSVSALERLGYTDPARKYLFWADTSVLCGVASMYNSDEPSQRNPNNGFYPQYARVDSGCWGLGDGAREFSVEAHEVLHMLGGVQNSAPHATGLGHCWDEADALCYDDGSGVAMRSVCAGTKEFFYDCNNDDYFSTYARAGSYLATHWNAADSRFLVGGGDGTSGGTLGSPTRLGGAVLVNGPAVPGLPTQVTASVDLPRGRSLTSVRWTSARPDCTFSAPTVVQSAVTCSASSGASTTVTVTLTDSSGARVAATAALTFGLGAPRQLRLVVSAAEQGTDQGSTASVCNGAAFPLRARVVDVASGNPVKGLDVTFTRQSGGLLGSLGSLLSNLLGVTELTPIVSVATAFTASTAPSTFYAAAPSTTLTAVPSTCATTLTGQLSRTSSYYGDPITVSGTVTRRVGTRTLPVAGLDLPISQVPGGQAGSAQRLGTATTGADGAYTAVVRPVAGGPVSVEVPGSTSYLARSTSLGTVTVAVPQTALSSSISSRNVGSGTPVVVSGLLERVAGAQRSPIAGVVSILLRTADGASRTIGTARAESGRFSVRVPLRSSGELTVSYPGVAGQPAATSVLGPVVVGRWTASISELASSMSIGPGRGRTTVSGVLRKTYAGRAEPAGGVPLSLRFSAARSGRTVVLGSLRTTAAGGFSGALPTLSSGLLGVLAQPGADYVAGAGNPVPLTLARASR